MEGFPVILMFLAGISALMAGCSTSDVGPGVIQETLPPVSATPTPESPVAQQPVADMALNPADLPPDYLLKDRAVIAYAGVDNLFRSLGWQQGYRVSFYRLDKKHDDRTSVTQEIGIYRTDTIKEVYTLRKEALLPPDNHATDYQIPFPQLGERSIAWREVREDTGEPVVTYTVIFAKKNVFEEISMSGTSTDYETFKTLVQAAASKVR